MKIIFKELAKISMVSAVGIVLTATASTAAVVDFEDVSATGNGNATPDGPQSSGGFDFVPTNTNDLLAIQNGSPSNFPLQGTNYLSIYNFDQTPNFEVEMTASNGRAFNLRGFQFSELFDFIVPPGSFMNVEGSLIGGGTVSASFEFNQTPLEFQTAILTGFFNLDSVVFSSDAVFPGLDNIQASEVPLPAGGLLLLSGLIGAIGLGRRKEKAA